MLIHAPPLLVKTSGTGETAGSHLLSIPPGSTSLEPRARSGILHCHLGESVFVCVPSFPPPMSSLQLQKHLSRFFLPGLSCNIPIFHPPKVSISLLFSLALNSCLAVMDDLKMDFQAASRDSTANKGCLRQESSGGQDLALYAGACRLLPSSQRRPTTTGSAGGPSRFPPPPWHHLLPAPERSH